MTTVETPFGAQGNPPTETAGQPADPVDGEPTAPDPEVSTDDHGDDDNDDDDQGDAAPNRERKLRHRAQAAEAERDALHETLGRTRQAIVNAAVSAAGHDPEQFGRLLGATERTADSLLGDDAMIDVGKLREAITVTAREFHVSARVGLSPNPQQALHGGGNPGGSSWSSALKGR